MISANKLIELSVKKQTSALNIRREYVQHLFLSYFYQQPQTVNIFFRGGTALQFIYNNSRFSEDLDFSTTYEDINEIETALIDCLKEIEREGIGVEVIDSKKTSGGYLGLIMFQLIEHQISIQIEISFREKDIRGEVTTIISYFVPSYTIVALVKEQLVGQKIRALLTRQKPRDFYDLYFILRANLLPPQEKSILPKVLRLLAESKIPFKKELEQFLPKSHWPVIKNFESNIRRELQTHI